MIAARNIQYPFQFLIKSAMVPLVKNDVLIAVCSSKLNGYSRFGRSESDAFLKLVHTAAVLAVYRLYRILVELSHIETGSSSGTYF